MSCRFGCGKLGKVLQGVAGEHCVSLDLNQLPGFIEEESSWGHHLATKALVLDLSLRL